MSKGSLTIQPDGLLTVTTHPGADTAALDTALSTFAERAGATVSQRTYQLTAASLWRARRRGLSLCVTGPPHVRSNLLVWVTLPMDLRQLPVFGNIDEQLPHEPTVETQNRKLKRPNPLASGELWIGDLRVYYDVTEDPQTVTVVAIGIKRGNRVFLGGREVTQ